MEAKFGRQKSPVRGEVRHGEDGSGGVDEPKREKRKKEKVVVAPVGQEMIIVNVNDRLGTKASIPCLASDPISMFAPLLLSDSGYFKRLGREKGLIWGWQNCSRRKSRRGLGDSRTRLC